MKHIKKLSDVINEDTKKFLPLDSLEWEYWNQSGHKLFAVDRNEEFNQHNSYWMDNLKHIADTEGLSLDDVISHLKKFWDESIRKEYVDMRVNRDRFLEFRDKLENDSK